ncbi:MAG: SMP-30/gluconolactonase/LRE family protein [Dehalococcoidia bacterium]
MKTYESKVLTEGIVFGEGPRWHDGKLWVSDMYGLRVLTVDPGGAIETVVEVPKQPSGLGWMPDGSLLIVSMLDRKLLRLADGRLEEHADLSSLAGGPLNDMVVDGQGRAYVGNFGFDLSAGEPFQTTNLILVEPGGEARTVAADLRFPNGTVITPDGRTMIVAETFGSRLSAFDVAADGSLGERRTFAEIPDKQPDGICLDAEGAVWVSCFGQDEFIRVHEGGDISASVKVSRRAVACMLGGEDRRTLFLITAETTTADLAQGKSQGFIETVTVDVPGAGLP